MRKGEVLNSTMPNNILFNEKGEEVLNSTMANNIVILW